MTLKRENFDITGQAKNDNAIRHMGFASWISKAADILTYVIVTAFHGTMDTRMHLKIALIRTSPLLFSLQPFCNLKLEKWTNICFLLLHKDLMQNKNKFMSSEEVTVSCVEDNSYIVEK
jgi:hypothetical protein